MERLLTIAWLAGLAALMLGAKEPAGRGESYMRVAQRGEAVDLEIAARRFEPARGKGPTIWLTGVVHVGDAGYYRKLQEHLDAQALVLYEAGGGPDPLPAVPTEGRRRGFTRQNLRLIGDQLEAHRRRTGVYPATLGLLRQATRERSTMRAAWLGAAMRDGWGHSVHYTRHDDGQGYTLQSAGPDGVHQDSGGDDVKLTGPADDAGRARANGPTMHETVADGLDLTFQLDAINYDQPHFTHSDITVRQMRALVEEGDTRLEELMATLDGSSLTAQLLEIVFNIVGQSPQLRQIVRLMIVEMIGTMSEQTLRNVELDEGIAELIIDGRNRIVMRQLKRVLARPDAPASVSIFYGAAHMPDFEARLRRLGYEPRQALWFRAMTAEPAKAGVSAATTQAVRAMVQTQLKTMQKRLEVRRKSREQPPQQ